MLSIKSIEEAKAIWEKITELEDLARLNVGEWISHQPTVIQDIPEQEDSYSNEKDMTVQMFILMFSTRTSYHSNLIGRCACDSRKLPKLVTFLCKDPSDSDLLPHDDPVPLTNKFGELPVEKVELIKDSIYNIQVNPPCSDTAAPVVKLDSFSPLSVEDVSNIISTSYNASCTLVLIPKWLVKSCLDILAPSITQKFLAVGYRHKLSKIAIVSITIGDSTIQPLNSVQNLGSWFDSDKSMSIHI
ncbi:unnamed protein product, partial [Pocillopora meandrina]